MELSIYATFVTTTVAVLTLVKAVHEYTKQNKENRAKQFLDLRVAYRTSQQFQRISSLLTDDEDELKEIPWQERFEYMAFFEDIAFLVNSNLIQVEVAYYMFGYDVLRAWRSNKFWNNGLRSHRYWALLSDFVSRLEKLDNKFQYDRKVMQL